MYELYKSYMDYMHECMFLYAYRHSVFICVYIEIQKYT
jgi:hypothetical protein